MASSLVNPRSVILAIEEEGIPLFVVEVDVDEDEEVAAAGAAECVVDEAAAGGA